MNRSFRSRRGIGDDDGIEYEARPIETDRLLLRPFEERDLDAMYAIWSRPDVVRLLYQEPQTREQTAEMVRLKAGRRVLRADGDYMNLAIDLRSTGELIGDSLLALHSVANRQGEIGFVLHPDHHGNGYATEASRSLLRIAFEELGLRRLIANAFADNEPSWRLMERVGMRRELYAVKESLHRSGEWLDGISYALLAEEWSRLRSTT